MLDQTEERHADRKELRFVHVQLKQDDEVREQVQRVGGECQPGVFLCVGFHRPERGGDGDRNGRIQPAEDDRPEGDDDPQSKPAVEQGRLPAFCVLKFAQDESRSVIEGRDDDHGMNPLGCAE